MGLLKSGACFTEELELNCPTIVGCVTALPLGPAAVAGTTQVLGKDGQFHALPTAPAPSLALTGNQLTIAGGNTVTLPDSATPTPQVLSLYNDTLTLSGGGGSVVLPDNDNQTLDLQGNVLSISGGNSVVLPAGAATVFATPAETVAGTSTTLAVNPADLYARENIAAQTGLSNDVTTIPAPTAGQSPFGVTTCGSVVEYIPNVGWKKIAEQNWTASAEWGACYASVAPAVGQVLAISDVLSVTNPDTCKAANVLISCEARDNTLSFFAPGTIRANLQISFNGGAWVDCGTLGATLPAGQSISIPMGTFSRSRVIPPSASYTAQARVICAANDTGVNQIGGCLILSLLGVI